MSYVKQINKYLQYCNKKNIIFKPSNLSTLSNYCDIKNFWNNKINKISNRLFIPSNDNLISKQNYIYNTWFKNETYCGNIIGDTIKCDKDNKHSTILKTRTIRFYPNKLQHKYLQRFFGCYRYFYNRTIEYFNNINKDTLTSHYTCDDNKYEVKFDNLKDMYYDKLIRDKLYVNKPDFLRDLNIHTHCTHNAIFEAVKNVKTNLKHSKHFRLKYKSKRDLTYSMNLNKTMINQKYKTFFPNYSNNGNKFIFRNMKYGKHSNIFGDFFNKIHSCIIHYHRILNRYSLFICYEDDTKDNNNKKTVSIDPGVRTFLSCYCDDKAFKIGIDSNDELNKINENIDNIKSILDTTKSKSKKKKLRKAIHKRLFKLKNKVKELHDKSINFLVSNFKEIIIPPFETQDMVKRLSNKTSRNINNLSFYRFKDKLRSKCIEYNVNIIEYNEAYTSKTCTKCGHIDNELGSKKVYKCKKCGLVIDRDLNGARNIMLKNKF